MADSVIEHTTFTWDPVSAAWVHEKGPQLTPPPTPPDVHALQSYFYDDDSKQWIRTVLGPMGRELAAKWQGAHRIPQDGPMPAVRKKTAPAKHAGPSPVLLVIAVVFVAMIGGAGIVGAQNGLFTSMPTTLDSLASFIPQATPDAATAAPVVAPASESASPVASAAATVAATAAPVVAPTRAPAPPTAALPAGPNAKLADGTTAVYTGATLVVKPAVLAATFTLVAANGRPGSGDATVVLGTVSVPALIDANGRLAATVATTSLAAGQYPIQLIYKGTLTPVAFITVR